MDTWIKVMLWVLGVDCVTKLAILGMGEKLVRSRAGIAIDLLAGAILFVTGLVQFMKH